MLITERMQSPTATINEIATLIKSDVGLASKILRLANSSYYSIPGGVTDVTKALQYLGFNTIAQIVLTTSVFGTFKSAGNSYFPLSSFWKHCFAVGLLAEITARNLQFKNPSDAFIGGLMHDIGKLILLEMDPEQLSRIIHHAKEHQISFLEAEKALGYITHIDMGVELSQHWNLPPAVISAIQYHHGGGSKPEPLMIEWANAWVNTHEFGHSGNFNEKDPEHEIALAKNLGLTERQLQQINQHFVKEFEKAGAILNGS